MNRWTMPGTELFHLYSSSSSSYWSFSPHTPNAVHFQFNYAVSHYPHQTCTFHGEEAGDARKSSLSQSSTRPNWTKRSSRAFQRQRRLRSVGRGFLFDALFGNWWWSDEAKNTPEDDEEVEDGLFFIAQVQVVVESLIGSRFRLFVNQGTTIHHSAVMRLKSGSSGFPKILWIEIDPIRRPWIPLHGDRSHFQINIIGKSTYYAIPQI